MWYFSFPLRIRNSHGVASVKHFQLVLWDLFSDYLFHCCSKFTGRLEFCFVSMWGTYCIFVDIFVFYIMRIRLNISHHASQLSNHSDVVAHTFDRNKTTLLLHLKILRGVSIKQLRFKLKFFVHLFLPLDT